MNNTPLPEDVVKMIEKEADKYCSPFELSGNTAQQNFKFLAAEVLTNEPLLTAAGWVRKEDVEKRDNEIVELKKVIKIQQDLQWKRIIKNL
jgi:hypothetical protein